MLTKKKHSLLTIQIPQGINEINTLIQRTIWKEWICQIKPILLVCNSSHLIVCVAIIQIQSTKIIKCLVQVGLHLILYIELSLTYIKWRCCDELPQACIYSSGITRSSKSAEDNRVIIVIVSKNRSQVNGLRCTVSNIIP